MCTGTASESSTIARRTERATMLTTTKCCRSSKNFAKPVLLQIKLRIDERSQSSGISEKNTFALYITRRIMKRKSNKKRKISSESRLIEELYAPARNFLRRRIIVRGYDNCGRLIKQNSVQAAFTTIHYLPRSINHKTFGKRKSAFHLTQETSSLISRKHWSFESDIEDWENTEKYRGIRIHTDTQVSQTNRTRYRLMHTSIKHKHTTSIKHTSIKDIQWKKL